MFHLRRSQFLQVFNNSPDETSYYRSVLILFFFFLSFLPGRVFSPALRPYMIGPMRSPDIQNLLEAFASLKRDLQWISTGLATSHKQISAPPQTPQTVTRQRVNRHPTASGLAHSFFRSSSRVHRVEVHWLASCKPRLSATLQRHIRPKID